MHGGGGGGGGGDAFRVFIITVLDLFSLHLCCPPVAGRRASRRLCFARAFRGSVGQTRRCTQTKLIPLSLHRHNKQIQQTIQTRGFAIWLHRLQSTDPPPTQTTTLKRKEKPTKVQYQNTWYFATHCSSVVATHHPTKVVHNSNTVVHPALLGLCIARVRWRSCAGGCQRGSHVKSFERKRDMAAAFAGCHGCWCTRSLVGLLDSPWLCLLVALLSFVA